MTHRQRDGTGAPESFRELDQRERALLRALVNNGGRCGLVRVAQSIAERESSGDPGAVRTRRLYTSLYHEELQSLVDAGLVTYCDENGELRLTPRGQSLWSESG
jgi:hypothetical protein